MKALIIIAIIFGFIIYRRMKIDATKAAAKQSAEVDAPATVMAPAHSSPHKPQRNRRFQALRGLTVASLKMYFRNRTAVFFSLFFPILFIVIFGSIFNSTGSTFKLDVVNQASTPLAKQFTTSLGNVGAFKVTDTSSSQAATDLNNGNADLAVIVPANFGQTQAGRLQPTTIVTHYNAAKPQNGQTANLVITQLVAGLNDQVNRTPQTITVHSVGVATRNLTYIDFLLPGMVGLSIMQLGIFSVAFAFVSFKTTGMLRRVQATPTHPSNFLAAQGLTRLIIAVAQTILLVAIGVIFFHFHLAPSSWIPFLLLALLGSVVFMGIGFIIAGWAKNEDQAQPVATLIQFPMMFLSGIFFPRAAFPPLLQTITGYLPLTYLGDALRQVANQGVSLWAVRGDILGLIIWGIIAYVAATRVFSWE